LSEDFLIVIPARIGSKRIVQKPLRKIYDKPLIGWVYEAARKITKNVIVATDSEEIVRVVEKLGGMAVITSRELPSGTDRVAEAVKRCGFNFRYIVNIQGDEPFVDESHVFPVVERLRKGDKFATVAVKFASADEVLDSNNVKVVLDKFGYALYFSRYPIPYNRYGVMESSDYFKHLGIYGFEKESLFRFVSWDVGFLEKAEKLEQLRILEYGEKIAVSIVSTYGFGIDTEEDLKKAEKLLKERFNGC